MKFLPPIIALLVITAWLGARHHSVRAVEKEVASLDHRIRAATTPDGQSGDHSLASRVREERDALLQPGQAIDWQRIANRFAASPQNRLEMGDFAALQQRVMEMSPDELVAALDEIVALGLPAVIDQQLEGMLLGQLARKAPQQALEKYGDKIGSKDGQYSWHLTEAIGIWAKDDPAAAGEWFDRKIAEGLFDSTTLNGRNQDRIRFEAAMVGALLPDHLGDAGRRLAALPEAQRAEIFQQHWLLKLKPADHQAFAALARDQLPAERVPQLLAGTASSLGRGENAYQRTSEFIDRIDARPEETEKIITQVAQNRIASLTQRRPANRADIDEMRDWLQRESPDSVDSTTGHILGKLTASGKDPDEIFTIATDLHQETGNDQVLAGFLANGTVKRHPGLARPLVESLSDPALRAKYLQEIDSIPVIGDLPSPGPSE